MLSSNSRTAGDRPPLLDRVRRGGRRAGLDAPASVPPHQLPEPVPATGDVAAVFDLDGTILSSNLVESYVWTRLAALPHRAWPKELLDLIRDAPRYALAERRERAAFVHTFLRRYAGTDEQALRRLVREGVGDALLHRVRPEAVRRLRAHRAAGHRTVLVTGGLGLLAQPLSPLFDDMVACHMGTKGGAMTGRPSSPPVVGEARREWMGEYAADHGLDLKRCYTYADSYSDRALLETVGSPCAVNPDSRLLRHAARSRWPVVHWGTHTGSRWEALVAAAAPAGGRRAGFAATDITDKGTR